MKLESDISEQLISRPFHIQLYCAAIATSDGDGSDLDYNGRKLKRTAPPSAMGFFGSSFEQWMQQMLKHGGVYAEGDGSWSRTALDKNERNAPAWRMEGMIYDRDGKVFYVDVQGQCTSDAWKDLIEALQVPAGSKLAICLAELGVWVCPDDFQRWLANN